MNAGSIRWVSVVIVSLCVPAVSHAALTCSALTSAGFATAIAAQAAPNDSTLPNITSFTVSLTCNRSAAGDATSVLVWANNGANALGAQNRARRGASRLNYEVYPNSDCVTGPIWTTAGTGTCTGAGCISVALDPVTGSQTKTFTVYGCVPLGQIGAAAGNYTDTVNMRIRNAANTAWLIAAQTFPVRITNPASCSVTSITNVNLSYTSFAASDSTASGTITLNCTSQLPYRMTLDSYSGALVGLNYTLDINGSTSPVDSRGTGPGQTHTVNGRIAAGQSGTCALASCNASQTHTLTVTW